MRPDPLAEARRWLAQAERDLDDARYVAQGQRWNLACFVAQQSAEKALKGFPYARGAEHVWGHSVAELAKDCAGFDATFRALQGVGASLDKYYVPTRYPNALPGALPADAYGHEDAQQALAAAEAIVSAARTRLEITS